MKQKKSLLVLVPVRLGLNSIQRAYLEQVKRHFQISANVGIAGGKDHAALYLVGDENANSPRGSILYLDPHVIQTSLPSVHARDPNFLGDLQTYHCTDARSLDPESLCTSMAPGFYLRDEAAFDAWALQMLRLKEDFGHECIYTVYDKRPVMREVQFIPMSAKKENKA
jgi:cysteine protease ATG4